jgi:predicted acetyltransferase
MTQPIQLQSPNQAMLPAYVAALEAGWSPSTTRDLTGEHLAAIRTDPAAFISNQREREGGTITLNDGRTVPRIPGPFFWISDGEFCGQINLRYQPGTLDLPPHVSGHVGYSIVPWKQRRGIASAALRLLLPIAAARGLPKVLITCDEGNEGSRKVIERSGGLYAGSQFDAEHGANKLLFWLTTG